MQGQFDLSDEQLMTQVMAGDRTALAALVERHHRPLLGYLYRMVEGNQPLAQDLTQETFVRLLQQDTFLPDRPFKPWLYAIATNLAHDYFRSASAKRTIAPGDDVLESIVDFHDGPEELAHTSEQGTAVRLALADLSDGYRAALILRFYNDLSLQEIAQALDIPVGTVKSRLTVGIRRLREQLRASQEEFDVQSK